MHCDAFLSYSHRVDAFRAKALQHVLQNLARPFYRRKALSIFRDETSLSANPALWPAIERGLEGARHFILMASPESAASVWCAKEVKWWMENRSRETLLIVLTGGELAYDENARDFDWSRTTALPASLAGMFSSEPFYVDLRWAGEADVVSTNARFRAAVLPLAAALHGVEPQELESEDLRQFRRTRRYWRVAAAALMLLTIASTAAAWIAIEQRDAAEGARLEETRQRYLALKSQQAAIRERDEAVRQRNLAVAHQLAIRAEFLQNDKAGLLPQSMLLAAESLRRAPSLEADRTLRRGLALLPPRLDEARYRALFGADAHASGPNRIAFFSRVPPEGGEVRIVEIAADRIVSIGRWRTTTLVDYLAFDHSGTRLSFGGRDEAIYLWELPAKAPRKMLDCEDEFRASAVSAKWLAVSCEGNALQLIELSTGSVRDAGLHSGMVTGLAFSADETRLAAARADNTFVVWETEGWTEVFRYGAGAAGRLWHRSWVAFSPNGNRVTKSSPVFDTTLQVWDLTTKKEIARLPHDDVILAAAFDRAGERIATASRNGKVRVFDIASGRLLADLQHQGAVREIHFAKRDDHDWSEVLVTAGGDGTARIWRIEDGRELTRATLGGEVVAAIAREGSANRIAALDVHGTLRLFGGSAQHLMYSNTSVFAVGAVEWSPSANAFVVGYQNGPAERLTPGGKRARLFDDLFDATHSVWSADGGTLLQSGHGGTRVWDAVRGRRRDLPDIQASALSADGGTIGLIDEDGIARVMRGREELRRIRDPAGRPATYWTLAVSRHYMAAGFAQDIVVRSLDDPRHRAVVVPAVDAGVLVFSSDERFVAWTGLHPGAVDVETGQRITLEGAGRFAFGKKILFAPATSHLAMATENRFAVWALPSGRQIAGVRLENEVTALAFSRDGSSFTTGSADGTARVWRLADGAERARVDLANVELSGTGFVPLPKGTTLPVEIVALSANGDSLLTATGNTSVVWMLAPERLIAETCRHVADRLTKAEWVAYANEEPFVDTCASAKRKEALVSK